MNISRFQKLLSSLLVLAVVLVIGNAWLAFHAEEVLADSEHWVTHTLEVINNMERILGTASQAESSTRGYLLTGNEAYLGPYRSSAGQIPGQFEMLRHLVGDNASQVATINATESIADQKLQYMAQMIAQRRTHGLGSMDTALTAGKGEALMRALVQRVRESQQRERDLLAARLHDSSQARTEARLTVAVASTLDILFVIFSLWSLRYERRLRQQAAETTERLEKLQSVTEVAFRQTSLHELSSELLARLHKAAHADELVLCRWFGDSFEIIAAEGVVVTPGERRQVRPQGSLARAAQTGEVVRLTGEEMKGLPIEALHSGLGAKLVLPVTLDTRVIALLVAGRVSSDGFSRSDEELLRLAADRIAVALDRAAAYDAERAARQAAEASAAEIQLLNEVLEERVQQRTAELETTNRELEAFSYSVSHDLRAPLRTVDGFSVALTEDYGHLLEGDGKHYLARIRVGVQRMGQLIDALLQLSRITRADLTLEEVDVSAVAQSVADELVQSHPERPLVFDVEHGLSVDGDSRLLRVVFENMFGNAVKFTSKVAAPVIAFGWSAERQAYFIRDNGAGFDQQYAGKLFVAFQRLHGDKDFQGSGIGLATVARVIRRHHGNIYAEGEVGHGATFWFTLG